MTLLKISVVLLPDQLHKNYEENIKQIVNKKLTNATIDNIGIIYSVDSFESICGGKINLFGSSVFSVNVNVSILKIEVDDVIESCVSNVTTHGFYVNIKQQEIFSLYDEHTTINDVFIQQPVKIRITKVKYNIDTKKFVIIATRILES